MPMRPSFAIGKEKVRPGTRMTAELPVSSLSDHTPVTMSAHVIHGKLDGRVVFVSAGIHGDEVIGMEIVRRLLKSSALRGMRGTLIVVPIVNSFGFINRSRYLPDRRDLNRSFPGSEEGSLAARLANLFMSEVVSRADLGIDLHSAAVHRTNYPQVRVSHDDVHMHEMANAFGAPIVMQSAAREGSLRQAAAALGKPVLLYEAGEGLRFDEVSVRVGQVGILRLLKSLGMISGRRVAAPRGMPQLCGSSKWLRAPIGGLFRSLKSDGDSVYKGDILGVVSDPFGETDCEIIAPFDGIIVGRAVLPVTNEGDAVFHLARVQSVEKAEDAMDNHLSQLNDDPMFDEDEII